MGVIRRADESESIARASLLSVSEVAAMFQVSKMTVYRMIYSGTLESVRFGQTYRILAESLQTHTTVDRRGKILTKAAAARSTEE